MQGAGGTLPEDHGGIQHRHSCWRRSNPWTASRICMCPARPNFDFAATLPQFNAVNSYKVTRGHHCRFIEAAFSGEQWCGKSWRARWCIPRPRRAPRSTRSESVTIANTSNPTDPGIRAYSDPTPTSSSGLLHPAVAVVEFHLLIPPGAAAALRRLGDHDASEARPARADSDRQFHQPRVRNHLLGNADLKPIKRLFRGPIGRVVLPAAIRAHRRAVRQEDPRLHHHRVQNNVDLGVLEYFNGSTTPVGVPLHRFRAITATRASRTGVESASSTFMEMGLGVHVQYTRTWSKALRSTASRGPAQGVSSNTGSIGVIYEKGPISANVNWDLRCKSCSDLHRDPGMSAYQASSPG